MNLLEHEALKETDSFFYVYLYIYLVSGSPVRAGTVSPAPSKRLTQDKTHSDFLLKK